MTNLLRGGPLALVLLVPGLARAALDPELTKPYGLRVVLHFGDHPALTTVLQDRVERELRDGLRGAFGELAKVEVVRGDRLTKAEREAVAKGLPLLHTWAESPPHKTHFVTVGFDGTRYEIEARPHDGATSLAGPVVRRDGTRDREFVAKAAALLVQHDFGVTGTFDSWPVGNEQGLPVKLTLKGGGLAVPWERFVRKDEVFAVVAVPAAARRPVPVPFALVQVTAPPKDGSRDGVCEGRLFRRYAPPDAADVRGFRCVKLGTVQGPLRVRVVQSNDDGDVPARVSLEVRRAGFHGEEGDTLAAATDATGSFDSSRLGDRGVFRHVAFVSVLRGDKVDAQVPVALCDDRPQELPVKPLNDADFNARIARADWYRRVSDSYEVQRALFQDLVKPVQTSRERTALTEAAAKGVERAAEEHRNLTAERRKLFADNPKLSGTEPASLARSDEMLARLKAGEDELRKFVGEQKAIATEEPVKQAWLAEVARARRLDDNLDVGEALKLYRALVAQGEEKKYPQTDELKKHLAARERAWKPFDDKHAAARRFIYERWPLLSTDELKARMDEAKAALAQCERVGDTLGPQKMLLEAQGHVRRLEKELARLNPRLNIDEEAPAEKIRDVGVELAALIKQITDYLDKRPKPEKK